MGSSSLAAGTHPPTGQTLPKRPVLWWLHLPCCHPPNGHGMVTTEEVGIGEGGRKGGKKQEEGGRKAMAKLGLLFGPKGGWVGMPGEQLGWRKGV